MPTTDAAGHWRETPKIVFSRTLEKADWNTVDSRVVILHYQPEHEAPAG